MHLLLRPQVHHERVRAAKHAGSGDGVHGVEEVEHQLVAGLVDVEAELGGVREEGQHREVLGLTL